MRAVAHECFALGWAVLEGPAGYYYGRPGIARDWRTHRHRALRRLIAAARTVKQTAFVREAEGRRQAAPLLEGVKRWPAGHQIDLVELLEARA